MVHIVTPQSLADQVTGKDGKIFVGRALLAIAKNQRAGKEGFMFHDSFYGMNHAHYFEQHGDLPQYMVDVWTAPVYANGLPRIVKYWALLDDLAKESVSMEAV